jgi:hypothetical protein
MGRSLLLVLVHALCGSRASASFGTREGAVLSLKKHMRFRKEHDAAPFVSPYTLYETLATDVFDLKVY